jgi:hypothetical protein
MMEHMKPTPKSETFKVFTDALRHIVSVPKSEVDARIKAKRRPHTKREASGHVSG